MMNANIRTDYIGHDRAYQRNRNNPDYIGWMKLEEFIEDWQRSWQPFIQNKVFPKQGTLIELGCGAGNLSISLAQRGYQVTGIDIAPTAIDWARENSAKANVEIPFIQGDVINLSPIANESFDIALDGRCFHCIIGSDRARFLINIHRILKPAGILAVNTMCNDVPQTPHWSDCFDSQTRCTIYNGLATRYIGDSNHILQEIIQANFRILYSEIVPNVNEDDLAQLQVIAEKIYQ